MTELSSRIGQTPVTATLTPLHSTPHVGRTVLGFADTYAGDDFDTGHQSAVLGWLLQHHNSNGARSTFLKSNCLQI